MPILRTNVDWWKARFRERVGNPYVYAGTFSPSNARQGCDCSALAAHVLNGVLFGPNMTWQRVDPTRGNAWITTESWRPIEVGQRGPFGTITVARPQDIPADAAVKIALHHGPGGGANSHMWLECDGVRMESAGSKGCCTQPKAWPIDHSYGNDWAYLPGPISGSTPDTAAVVTLATATGLSLSRAAEILPTVQGGLRLAECDNPRRIGMALAQWGHESDNFNATEEYASGAAYEGRCSDLGNCQPGDGVKFKGRTWIQVTGRAHYASFSKWCHSKGLVPTPTYFVDSPRELAELRWAGVGAAWYWTVERPQINSLCDAGDLIGVTKAINGGTNGLEDFNGRPGRRTRYNRAMALGDQLLALLGDSVDPLEELLMLKVPSMSIYATPGEPDVAVVDMIRALDAHGPHEPYVENLARKGDPDALMRVARTAAGKGVYGNAAAAVNQAIAVLAEIDGKSTDEIRALLKG